MPRVCNVCLLPPAALHELELCVVRKEATKRGIARKFRVSEDSLDRHIASGHISAKLAKAAEAVEVVQGADLRATASARLEDVRTRVLGLLDDLGTAKRPSVRLECLKELRQQIRLQGELEGELITAQTIVNNNQQVLITSLELSAIMRAIASVLRPHPDLARELAAKLGEIAPTLLASPAGTLAEKNEVRPC